MRRAFERRWWRRYRPWEIVLIHLVTLLPAASVLAVSFCYSPDDLERGEAGFIPDCTVQRYLGVECPTCGLSRAFCALSRGQWGRAVAYNRLSPVWYAGAVLVFAVGALSAGTCVLGPGGDPRGRRER